MALFKILKGTAAKLPSNKVEGYCYVTTDTHKMYVDTSADARICLNAANADTATKLATSRTITIGGAVTGSMKFDGSSDITITTSVNHTHSYAGSASVGGDANRAVKVKDSTNGKDITITYGKAAQTSTSWLASWNDYELGAISPANITAGKATQLAASKTIALGTAVTSTATGFNGASNITIPVTGVKEKYLTWGGKNIVGDVAPIDAAMSYLHNANRAQFAKPAGITIQYSTDGGSTWLDYGATDQQKIQFVSGLTKSAFYLGKQTSGTGLINNQLRIIINASACNFYTRLKTVLIYISKNGNTNLTCQIDKAMRGSESTFLSTPVGTYTLSGWPEWNSIPFDIFFGGGQTQTSNIGALRFTFKYAAAPATNQNANIIEMMFLGTTAWIVNSNMANTGHLYAWDYAQNATFPAQISATKFNGSATSADTATKLAAAKTISIAGVTTGSVGFDGSSNVTISTSFDRHTIDTQNKNNYPFKRIASLVAGTAFSLDCNMIVRITEEFSGGYTGVCKIAVRTDSADTAVRATAYWIETNSMNIPKIYVGILGKTGENVVADIYYKCRSPYARTQVEVISTKKGAWTLYNSSEVKNTTTTDKLTSVESYASVEEGGTTIRKSAYTSIVESEIKNCASILSAGYGATNVPVYIKSDGQPAAIAYQVNKTVPANAVFTDTTYSSGNGITIDSNRKINHSNAAITAKTAYGSTATAASANGGSIVVTDVKYDAYGHITGSTDRTIKLSQTLYTLPTAGSSLGGVKTTSTVTSASGYTACPIIGGVPYYKDTNTTYTLAGLMGSAAKGSATQPVYWTGSAWANTTYTLGKSVPSDAKFTDTVYTLPTAGSTLGGVKTTSTVTSNSGYTACPIISGVPYYKDTNTTYTLAGLMGSSAKGSATQPVYWTGSAWANTTYTLGKSVPSDAKFTDTTYTLSSFGVTASATELNYCKGVTSAIQTQLNGKASSSHSHSYLPLSGGTMSGNINSPILGQGQWIQVADKGLIKTTTAPASGQASATVSIKSTIGYWGIGTLGNYNGLYFFHAKDSDIAAGNNVYGVTYIDTAGGVHGAVWNDYAEYRISDCLEPGRVVCENGDDTLSMSTKRLQPGANIVSDTFGFSIGETDEAKCPIAVSGRVLAYGYEDRDEFRKNIGRPVCAGPNGTVSIMTDEEYKNYGYCAIGTISAVPNYEEWGTGKVKVNNRIWIKV